MWIFKALNGYFNWSLRLVMISKIEIYGKLEPEKFQGLPKIPVFHVLFFKKILSFID